jgi:hypothetical protein
MMPRLSLTLSFLTVLLLLSCGRSTEEGPLPGDGTVQVYPAVERVKAARRVRIPIINNSDSGEPSAVNILWEQFADGQGVASGEARLDIPTKRTGLLRLQLSPSGGVYENHLLLTFLRLDGTVITRRSVELETPSRYTPADIGFDPMTLILSIRPAVLHPSGQPDPRRAAEEVITTEDRRAGGEEKYYTKTRYRFDDGSSLVFEMEYALSPTRLHVEYAITPETQPAGQTRFGVSVRPHGLRGVRYVGPGPQGADPTFGLWPYEGGLQAVRCVLLELWEGTLRVDGPEYLESGSAPDEVLLLGGASAAPFTGSLDFTIK